MSARHARRVSTCSQECDQVYAPCDMTMLRHRYRWRRSSARIMQVGVLRIGAIGQQRRDKEAQESNVLCIDFLAVFRGGLEGETRFHMHRKGHHRGPNMARCDMIAIPATVFPECSAYACSRAQIMLHITTEAHACHSSPRVSDQKTTHHLSLNVHATY